MLLKIDFQSDVPIYLQLKNQIIEGIATGKLKRGEALPSVRQLGENLGINLHTVNKTYTLLKQDGFITVHRQKGVVINQEQAIGITPGYLEQLQADLRPLITEAFCRGMTEQEFNRLTKAIFENIKEGGKI